MKDTKGVTRSHKFEGGTIQWPKEKEQIIIFSSETTNSNDLLVPTNNHVKSSTKNPHFVLNWHKKGLMIARE